MSSSISEYLFQTLSLLRNFDSFSKRYPMQFFSLSLIRFLKRWSFTRFLQPVENYSHCRSGLFYWHLRHRVSPHFYFSLLETSHRARSSVSRQIWQIGRSARPKALIASSTCLMTPLSLHNIQFIIDSKYIRGQLILKQQKSTYIKIKSQKQISFGMAKVAPHKCMMQCINKINNEFNFIKIQISKQGTQMYDQEDSVVLKIPTAREKLLPNFPNDNRGDVKIIFRSKSFFLAKAYLRLQSGFFKKVFTPTVTVYEIKENFSQEAFEKVMSCFYGASISMPRNQLGVYYPIIKFLQIDSILLFLKKDIEKNISEYDLFVVMKIAHSYLEQQIFEACLEQLQKQSFEQLKYHQFQLLQTDLPLFKLIIKTHDRHRMEGKPGIPYTEINQIIKDYADGRGLGDDGYLALKYQLISQNSLSASQYKEIFLNEVIKMKGKTSASTIVGDYPTNQSILVNGTVNLTGARLETNKLAESVIATGNVVSKNPEALVAQSPSNIGYSTINNQNSGFGHQMGLSNELTLQMQNTYQKKQNEELRNQNRILSESLQNLKLLTEQNRAIHEQMSRELNILKQELKKKQSEELEHKKMITKFENTIAIMHKELQKKTQDIDWLAEQIEELKKRRPLTEEQEQNNMIVQSQFLPAHLIGEMMSEATPKPRPSEIKNQNTKNSDTVNYEGMDDEQLEEHYLPRIKFDFEPIGIPKYHLPRVCKFITAEGFSKHSLNLIYRRSVSANPRGNNSDIRMKKNLLILICTASGQHIGGFVSVPIQSGKEDYISDQGAFLFSLTKDRKFTIKKCEEPEAIFMSEQYLLCFANDLMIASDCLKQKSECSWPSSYEGVKGLKQKGSVWFAGQSQFLIKHIEIYEMGEEEEMEMVL